MDKNKIKLFPIIILSLIIAVVVSYYTATFLGKTLFFSLFGSFHDMAGIASYSFAYFIFFPLFSGFLCAASFSRGAFIFKKTDNLTVHPDINDTPIVFFITSVFSFIIAYYFLW